MNSDLYLTVEGLQELQFMDFCEMQSKREQNYSQAPLRDLLDILALEHRMGARNAKIARLEGIVDDLPF